ncbi:hypothetical protein C8R44DRAFT_866553 [Mycena epipterygia]|nr:hypothetical protein C8R44DRAFT_866553 [Mycena epipterygia]
MLQKATKERARERKNNGREQDERAMNRGGAQRTTASPATQELVSTQNTKAQQHRTPCGHLRDRLSIGSLGARKEGPGRDLLQGLPRLAPTASPAHHSPAHVQRRSEHLAQARAHPPATPHISTPADPCQQHAAHPPATPHAPHYASTARACAR